jgi:4-aminobutyrate aminotransferase-like enzyme
MTSEGNDIAATVMEPLCGEGGLIVPPAKAVKGMYEVTRDVGGFFISDEVQAGMGRTGKMFAIENHDVVPDLDWPCTDVLRPNSSF